MVSINAKKIIGREETMYSTILSSDLITVSVIVTVEISIVDGTRKVTPIRQ